MQALDPRLNAFRPDLADEALQGRVEAARFAHPRPMRVAAARAPVRAAPAPDATMLSEALAGESVAVFETTPAGWAWVQLQRDRYVGWMHGACLAKPAAAPTHKVTALSTFAFDGPDIKRPPLAVLPLGAEVTVTGTADDRNAGYALIAPTGAVVMQHLAPLDARAPDWVAVAERFLGTPYLWGGKTSHGIDCSGLVQVALQAAGISAPRDSDMQEQALGAALPLAQEVPPLRRGDLVFWRGHVGIMRDAETLLHANAHHMAVAYEPLRAMLDRTSAKGIEVISVRRLGGE